MSAKARKTEGVRGKAQTAMYSSLKPRVSQPIPSKTANLSTTAFKLICVDFYAF